MANVIISHEAYADRAQILSTIFHEAGAEPATKYVNRFRKLFLQLSQFPASCQACPALGRGIRTGHVRKYVVIYRYNKTKDTVTVLRIFHSKRFITKAHLRGL